MALGGTVPVAGGQGAAPTSSRRLVLTLAIAGLISGIGIIGIYETTLPTITRNKARELREAVFRVVPGAARLQALVHRDGKLVPSTASDKGLTPIYGGYDATGRFLGYAIAGSGPGFQDTIGLLYGYDAASETLLGMEVLESRETPGLGDKIYKDPKFVADFRGLSVKPQIVAVKKGRRQGANEVDAITGATISSKAVVRIINEANAAWLPRLPGAGAEPPLGATDEAALGSAHGQAADER